MNEIELKHSIESSIRAFLSGSISQNALNLFAKLGYKTDRQNPFIEKTYCFFKESFLEPDTSFNEAKARVDDWKSIDLLFQLTQEELSDQRSIFDTKKVNNTIIETYLFFAIELNKTDYSRSALAQITREINKIFPMPVMLLFKYGDYLTLSVINRRLNKKDEQKDVLEKVTLIKDISTQNPHRAHIEILFDLSFDELKRLHKFTNFVELHNAWQKTLDTKELNKRFYRELSNWYFWAINNVSFPNDIDNDKDDTIFNSESIIRLLTRLIFIWFIKEKNLIPDKIFDRKEVSKIIKGFNTKGSTVYYRAILQNLFFATLNQKIEERAFATDGTFEQNKKNYGIKNLYRYSSDFAISKEEVNKLFKDVPFLNGGLFDCLDNEDKNGVVMYLDGFSRNPKKQAQVPDELFFSQEKIIDLSAVYDNKKKKNEIVKGLFVIFSHYKFTITENTPIEEEVALDPELLGRVFENLLASYNPETKTTARKQTGSFYTPREIVNYMVDESLKAYLKQKLETDAGMKPEDAEVGLEFLIGYNEKEHLFDEEQTSVLINAIDNCKILDPACGSGAFPMGILHKLVHILHKLDPQNKLWEERQIKKAMAIDDPEIRDTLIADIEIAFNNNELDYGRKLYLIENGIYGVDIQPIATQISKLRFFISLIVDQKVNKNKDNFGIRPLPNLETKFVAANTLIGINKPGGLLRNIELDKLEKILKDIRHRLFSAKNPATKRKLREEDQKLREEMGKILEKSGWSNESAHQLAAWDPYNQNASSPFFDPEWMFGITDGFDVVIGNPPYVRVHKQDEDLKNLLRQYYKSPFKDFDIYIVFIENGLNLLKRNGCLNFITPDKYLIREYGEKIRSVLLKYNICEFYDISRADDVFGAAVYPLISRIVKSDNTDKVKVKFAKSVSDLINPLSAYEVDQSKWIENNLIHLIEPGNIQTIDKIIDRSTVFKNIINKNNIFCGTPRAKDYYLWAEGLSEKKVKNSLRVLTCSNITPYCINHNLEIRTLGQRINHPYFHNENQIINDNLWKKFEHQPKILIRGNDKRITVALDNCGSVFVGVYGIILNDLNIELLSYFVGLLNSKLIQWVFLTKNPSLKIGGGYFSVNSPQLLDLPVIEPTSQKYSCFNETVKYVIILKELKTNSIFFEFLIDAMVYELYFSEEIKVADAEILKHLTNLPELKDEWSDEKKLKTIEEVYKELSDPNHPVSIAMERQKTVPEVRIIEELDK